MLFNFVLLPGLLVSMVLAHRRHEGHQSRTLNHIERASDAAPKVVLNSSSWSGALWDTDNETFTSITGTFTVPVLSGKSGTAASAWVGINGNSCMGGGGLLQTGVDFFATDSGPTCHAWYEWAPADTYYFSNLNLSAGDVIRVTVNASSPTSGTTMVENLTNGHNGLQQLNSTTSALCRQNAEWIVEDFWVANDNLIPFADFGTVTFIDAVATGTSGTYTPDGATIIIIEQNNQVMTSVSTNESSVIIKHV